MYPVNLVNLLPNMALLPRQIFFDYSKKSSGFKFSMMIGRDFPASIGFDIGIQNKSGGTAFYTKLKMVSLRIYPVHLSTM